MATATEETLSQKITNAIEDYKKEYKENKTKALKNSIDALHGEEHKTAREALESQIKEIEEGVKNELNKALKSEITNALKENGVELEKPQAKPTKKRKARKASEPTPDPTKSETEKVLAAIPASGSGKKAGDLSKETGIKFQVVRKACGSLSKKGKIKSDGQGAGATYVKA